MPRCIAIADVLPRRTGPSEFNELGVASSGSCAEPVIVAAVTVMSREVVEIARWFPVTMRVNAQVAAAG